MYAGPGRSRSSPTILELADLAGRTGLITVFGLFATIKALRIRSMVAEAERIDLERLLDLAAQAAGLAFLLLILAVTAVRLKPMRSAEGLEPRLTALLGTFFSIALVAFEPVQAGPLWRMLSIALVATGMLLSTWVLLRLGRSFSITAQARRLVTSGPYAIVRHPLYVCEEIAVVGLLLMCLSPGAVLVVAVQWMFQLRRMSNEERVLRAAFADYAAYAARTPKVIPNLPMTRAVQSSA